MYSLDPKPPIFTEHLLCSSSVLGAGAAVAKAEATGPCPQGAQGLAEEADRHRSNGPPGECALKPEAGCSGITGSRDNTE